MWTLPYNFVFADKMSGYFPNIRYPLVNVGIKTWNVHYYLPFVGLIFYQDRLAHAWAWWDQYAPPPSVDNTHAMFT